MYNSIREKVGFVFDQLLTILRMFLRLQAFKNGPLLLPDFSQLAHVVSPQRATWDGLHQLTNQHLNWSFLRGNVGVTIGTVGTVSTIPYL